MVKKSDEAARGGLQVMLGGIGADSRLHAKDSLPVLAALGLHAALLLLLISGRPPPHGKPTAATEIFLVSAVAAASPLRALSAEGPIKVSSETRRPTAFPAPPSTPAPGSGPSKPPPALNDAVSADGQAALKALISAAALPRPDVTATPVAISAAIGSTVPSSAQNGSSKTCQMLETLQAGLGGNPDVQAAIAAIPRQARSISNTVLLWNGRWLDLDADRGAAALQPIERVVTQIVAAAPLSCRTELLHGPRLVFLGDARDTLVLAFGSGDWRWADVAAGT